MRMKGIRFKTRAVNAEMSGNRFSCGKLNAGLQDRPGPSCNGYREERSSLPTKLNICERFANES
jgi:hypothetical protein